MRLNYVPQPRQLVLHQTIANQILYGGSAGGGKSKAVRWDAIDFCIHIPNLNATLFRRTLPMLLKNHIIALRRELVPNMGLGTYNETRKTFEFRNGSILSFQHIEYDRDTDDIQGPELHWAGIDEAGQMTPHMIAWVQSRVRLGEAKELFEEYAKREPKLKPYIDRLPRMVMSSNPGGESHHFLKEEFIDPAPPETVFKVTTESVLHPGKKIIKTRIFIPASMRDNKYLDEDYEAQFSGMPDWQRKQLIEGDWNVVPGAFFDCWNQQNIIKPFRVPDHWMRLWACDWGFRQPFAIGEFVIADGTTQDYTGKDVTYPDGAMILVREWYGQEKGNKGIRMSAFDVGQVLKDWQDAEIKVADPSMWRTDSGPSPAERFAQAGIYWARADNERDAGWQEMYARIKDKMLLAVETCRHFIRVIPTLEHDEKKLEDVAKKGEDHMGDMGRYACMARPYKKDRPKKELPWYQDIKPLTFNDVMNRRVPSSGPEVI